MNEPGLKGGRIPELGLEQTARETIVTDFYAPLLIKPVADV
jgi:hypothetical protein